MHIKKILFITHDKNNIFIKYLINSLKKNYKIDLHNPNKFKRNFLSKIGENFLIKVSDAISSYKKSNKEKFYINYQINNSNNFLKKVFFIFKKLINTLNLCFDKSDIYYQIFKNSKRYKNYIKKYDFVISDFRLNHLYNPDLRLIYEAAISKNTKLISWVYSWDNIYHSSVMKQSDYIFIWSKFFKKIINLNHNYKNHQIISSGSIQFDYLKKKYFKKTFNKKKILFACSYGSDSNNTGDNFIKDEINFLKVLSKSVWKIDKAYNIIVRPYPSALNDEYKNIKLLKNIKFKEYGKLIKRRKNDNEKIRFENDLNKKLDQILGSNIIISFGSTFNIEAAILNKIVLHVDFTSLEEEKYKSYNYFKNQMEYLKILKGKNFPNIIKSEKQLDLVMHELIIKKNIKKYLKYNSYLKKIFYDKKIAVDEFQKNLKII